MERGGGVGAPGRGEQLPAPAAEEAAGRSGCSFSTPMLGEGRMSWFLLDKMSLTGRVLSGLGRQWFRNQLEITCVSFWMCLWNFTLVWIHFFYLNHNRHSHWLYIVFTEIPNTSQHKYFCSALWCSFITVSLVWKLVSSMNIPMRFSEKLVFSVAQLWWDLATKFRKNPTISVLPAMGPFACTLVADWWLAFSSMR